MQRAHLFLNNYYSCRKNSLNEKYWRIINIRHEIYVFSNHNKSTFLKLGVVFILGAHAG